MKQFDPLREFLFDYITCVAENTLAIAVIGTIFVKNAQIGFGYFFPTLCAGISLYAALYSNLSERGYDDKTGADSEICRADCIGSGSGAYSPPYNRGYASAYRICGDYAFDCIF